jgi:hypothetical protein
MVARAFGVPIQGGYELQGPQASTALLVGTVIGWLAYAVIAALAWRLLVSGETPSAHRVAVTVSAVVAVLLVTNKVLSPQYLVWLAAPLALVFAPEREVRPSLLLAWLVLATAGLTNVMFPHFYEVLVGARSGFLLSVATGILVLRNLLLVCAALLLLRMAWARPRTEAGSPGMTRRITETGSSPAG